jgi:hypothetical protein
MSTWILLNFAWGALFVVAVVGVPLWLVIARPDTGPQRTPASLLYEQRTSASPLAPARRSPRVAAAAGAGQPTRTRPAGVS